VAGDDASGPRVFEFRVVDVSPQRDVVVADPRVISCRWEPGPRGAGPRFDFVCYDEVGGIGGAVMQLCERVERQETAAVLVTALVGCGKTFLSQAIRKETSAKAECIPGAELLAIPFDIGSAALERVLDVCRSPTVVFIDDLDVAAPEGDGPGQDPLRDALGVSIDKLRTMRGVVVIAMAKSEEGLGEVYTPRGALTSESRSVCPTRSTGSRCCAR